MRARPIIWCDGARDDMHDWICYILYGTLDGHTHVYVGKTNDMSRRLRQHRGEIVGGAKRTSRLRQRGVMWMLAATNQGFRDEREVLVFEAQMEAPRERRLLREHQSGLIYMKALPRALHNAHLLCKTAEFSHISVKVHDLGPHKELSYDVCAFEPSNIVQIPAEPRIKTERKSCVKKSALDLRIEKYAALQQTYINRFK